MLSPQNGELVGENCLGGPVCPIPGYLGDSIMGAPRSALSRGLALFRHLSRHRTLCSLGIRNGSGCVGGHFSLRFRAKYSGCFQEA